MEVWILFNSDYFHVYGVFEDEEQAFSAFLDKVNDGVPDHSKASTLEEAEEMDSYWHLFGPESVL